MYLDGKIAVVGAPEGDSVHPAQQLRYLPGDVIPSSGLPPTAFVDGRPLRLLAGLAQIMSDPIPHSNSDICRISGFHCYSS